MVSNITLKKNSPLFLIGSRTSGKSRPVSILTFVCLPDSSPPLMTSVDFLAYTAPLVFQQLCLEQPAVNPVSFPLTPVARAFENMNAHSPVASVGCSESLNIMEHPEHLFSFSSSDSF